MSADPADLVGTLPDWAQWLRDCGTAAGFTPYFTSTLRSYADQERLYRRYLAGESAYPAAPPGHSLHEVGRAFDLGGCTEQELAWLGSIWQSVGGRWGGAEGDPIHFEA